MQVSILNGTYTDVSGFRTSYPVNYMPIVDGNGISNYYLKPAEGLISIGSGPGIDRGGINWNGTCYRVMGTSLILINYSNGKFSYETLGTIPGYNPVVMCYSFDKLAIAADGFLHYYDSTNGLVQATDIDLGIVLDMLWVDGYFMTTDGEYLVVTELLDPTSIDPLKYGSSESDPDPIVGLVKIKNEVCVLNRYTTEFFSNTGGENFPFSRIESAQFQRGAIGRDCKVLYMDTIAFLGSGKNEPPAIWISNGGTSSKISTGEIDKKISKYTEQELKHVKLETRLEKFQNLLYVHLPDETLVYDGAASLFLKEPVWFILSSSINKDKKYRARNMVWCYDTWLFGDTDTSYVGTFSNDTYEHFGEEVGWEFATGIGYNKGKAGIIHSIELMCLPGRLVKTTIVNGEPTYPLIYTQQSIDGMSWGRMFPISAGRPGETDKRLMWTRQGYFNNYRMQKFLGTSDAVFPIVSLTAEIEVLNV